MKRKCTQRVNGFGFALPRACSELVWAACLTSVEQLASHVHGGCSTPPDVCIVHIYEPEDIFVEFVRRTLDEDTRV